MTDPNWPNTSPGSGLPGADGDATTVGNTAPFGDPGAGVPGQVPPYRTPPAGSPYGPPGYVAPAYGARQPVLTILVPAILTLRLRQVNTVSSRRPR